MSYEELLANAKELSNRTISVKVDQEVTAPISTVVSTNLSDYIYDEFTPIVT